LQTSPTWDDKRGKFNELEEIFFEFTNYLFKIVEGTSSGGTQSSAYLWKKRKNCALDNIHINLAQFFGVLGQSGCQIFHFFFSKISSIG
jgi:hypothetical protein